MSTRWAGIALCTLIAGASTLVGTMDGPPADVLGAPSSAGVAAAAVTRSASGSTAGAAGAAVAAPPLTLTSQTPWVTAAAPWFNLTLGVSGALGPASGLRVSMTFYGRIDDASQLQQAVNGTPGTAALLRLPAIPVSQTGANLGTSACVTVIPEAGASTPTSGEGVCAGGSPVLSLDCKPDTGTCGDVYPVSVALVREGQSTPVSRFTTFLTYQEPHGPVGHGGPLRVGLVVPAQGGEAGVDTTVGALADHRDVAATVAVSPTAVAAIERTRGRSGMRALSLLGELGATEILDQSFVPVNVAALSEAGLAGEIGFQVDRGDELLRGAGLKPSSGTWVDTASTFAQGDAGDLASGLQVAGASRFVLNDADLAAGGLSNYTFAQPFTLDLGHGSTVPAVASDSSLSARFTAQPGNPVLGGEQLLAGLSFVHFENAFLTAPRGVVVVPPSGWHPSGPFLETVLGGLSGNPALSAVTLSQLFDQVPAGGNREPSVRRLQAGPAGRGITRTAAQRIALNRQQLSSFTAAVKGRPPAMTVLSDALLATEARGLPTAGRAAALSAYGRAFDAATGQITLATERTVTFTARRAAIPVTILSSAPYPVTVLVTLTSDKFTFPDGQPPPLTLDRPTTSVRVTAQARTSGDRLPIDVTLHTPDGQLLIAHTVLTVHSTAISFVGVALTVLAGAVLGFWWVRTWRRSRRRRPRAAS